MKKVKIIAVLAATATAAPAISQDIQGASFEGAIRQYSDDGSNVTTLGAGIDVGLTSDFAVGGNLKLFDGDDFDSSIFNATLHGMYKYSEASAFGLFVAQESDDTADITIYGIEFGGAANGSSFEAYYGGVESDDLEDSDLTIAGLRFEFEVSPGFSLGLDYQSFTVPDLLVTTTDGDIFPEDVTFSDTALVARYQFESGPSVFAQIGQVSSSFSTDDTRFRSVEELEYVAVGAKYTIGRGTGNIFGNRSLLGFGGS